MQGSAEKLLPTYLFDKLPEFSLPGDDGGQIKFRTMAFVRRRADFTRDGVFTPLKAHLETLREALLERVKYQVGGWFNGRSYLAYVDSAIKWVSNDPTAINILTPDFRTIQDAYPVPGLQEVSYSMDTSGETSGKATFYIPNPVVAESVLFILQDACFRGDRLFQLVLPYLQIDEAGKTEWVMSTAIAGPISSVQVAEWPFKITVSFGDINSYIDRDSMAEQGNISGSGHEVLQALAKRGGFNAIEFYAKLPIGSVPALDSPQSVAVDSRPIRDIVEGWLNTLGLRFHWFVPYSLFGVIPAVLFVYPPDYAPEDALATGQGWPQWADYLLGQLKRFASTRRILSGAGLETSGAFNVFVPINADPNELRFQAALYVNGDEHANFLKRVASDLAANANANDLPGGSSAGPLAFAERIVGSLAVRAKNFFRDFLKVDSSFFLTPVYDILSFNFQPPGAEELQNSNIANLYSPTRAIVKTTTAAQAANQLNIQPDRQGQYTFPATGGGSFSANAQSPVYLNYDRDNGGFIGASRADLGLFAGNGGENTGEVQGNKVFYPYTLTLEVPPLMNVRPGIPSYIVGIRPLDGTWETARVEFELSDYTQRLLVYLRTNRAPLYASR